MNQAFWKGKKVFLTGHTGFKGSWLSLWLKKLGAEVTGYANGLPSDPCLFVAAGIDEGVQSINGDVRDLDELSRCIEQHQPEIVFHMAAQSLVRRSYDDPIETYSTNVMGTVNVLEAVRRTASVRAVLVVTSDKCYENREWLWSYRENEPMGGHDPYSNSKGCAELVTAAYRSSFFSEASYDPHGAAIASVRAGNVIGGGDWAEGRIVPDVINAFQRALPAKIRSPKSIRPWQFVLEPLHGYLLLAERLWSDDASFAGAWNFGPPDTDAENVSNIVQKLADAWGADAEWQNSSDAAVHEATYLKIDSSKAAALLQWTPSLPLDTTMNWIVEWYRHYFQNGDARDITLDQINRYHERVCT